MNPPSDTSHGKTGLGLHAVVLLGILIRFHRYFSEFPLFGDEAMLAIQVLGSNFGEIFGPLEYRMVASPGWLLFSKGSVELFGASEMALRLPALLLGSAGFIALVLGLRRFLLPRTLFLAAVGLATSYYLIRHSVESKPYAFDFFISVLLILAWLHQSRWRLPLALLAPWMSWPSVFVLGGILLGDLLKNPRLRGNRLVWAVLSAGSFFALWWLVGRDQHWGEKDWVGHAHQWQDDFPPLAQPWRFPWWLIQQHCGYMWAFPFGGKGFGSTLTLLLVSFGLIKANRPSLFFLRRTFLLLLALQLTASAFHLYPYGGSLRSNLHQVPFLAVFFAHGLIEIFPRRPRISTIACRCLIALMLFSGLFIAGKDFLHPFKNQHDQDLRTAVHDFFPRIRPGQSVYLWHGYLNGFEGQFPVRFSTARFRCLLLTELGLHALPMADPNEGDWVVHLGYGDIEKDFEKYCLAQQGGELFEYSISDNHHFDVFQIQRLSPD